MPTPTIQDVSTQFRLLIFVSFSNEVCVFSFVRYVFPRFSLCWAELLELKVRVPCETLDYVTANYGNSWSVPVMSWDWKSSPSNVLENGVWPPSDWAELIQVY